MRSALLSIGFLVACGGSSDPVLPSGSATVDTADTGSLDWPDTGEGTTTSAGFLSQSSGTATVVTGVRWEGAEQQILTDAESGEVSCAVTWVTNSTLPISPCDGCTFAFEVSYSDGVADSGICVDAGEDFSVNLAFAPSWTMEGSGTLVTDVLLREEPAGWEPLSYTMDGTVVNQLDDNTFTYKTPQTSF